MELFFFAVVLIAFCAFIAKAKPETSQVFLLILWALFLAPIPYYIGKWLFS